MKFVELRWLVTQDQHGVEVSRVLQVREMDEDEQPVSAWIDVPEEIVAQ